MESAAAPVPEWTNHWYRTRCYEDLPTTVCICEPKIVGKCIYVPLWVNRLDLYESSESERKHLQSLSSFALNSTAKLLSPELFEIVLPLSAPATTFEICLWGCPPSDEVNKGVQYRINTINTINNEAVPSQSKYIWDVTCSVEMLKSRELHFNVVPMRARASEQLCVFKTSKNVVRVCTRDLVGLAPQKKIEICVVVLQNGPLSSVTGNLVPRDYCSNLVCSQLAESEDGRCAVCALHE